MRNSIGFFIVFVFFYSTLSSQEIITKVDDSYLEDQFYMGITYNLLLKQPSGVSQRNLSYGLQFGFIKDIPLNKARTYGVGIGFGYAVNSYFSNLLATKSVNGFNYTVLDGDTSFKRNKVETHTIELPFELRWRTSTTSDYKFWRIYTGIKFSYGLGGRSKFVSDNDKQSFFNTDIRKFQYGLTFNFGYNTFNVHAYYSLKTLFNDSIVVEGSAIESRPLRIGLIFYIL